MREKKRRKKQGGNRGMVGKKMESNKRLFCRQDFEKLFKLGKGRFSR